MDEVALELDIEVWREAEKTCLRDSQRSDMEENGFREWSIRAGLKYFQKEKKKEAVDAVGSFLSLHC